METYGPERVAEIKLLVGEMPPNVRAEVRGGLDYEASVGLTVSRDDGERRSWLIGLTNYRELRLGKETEPRFNSLNDVLAAAKQFAAERV